MRGAEGPFRCLCLWMQCIGMEVLLSINCMQRGDFAILAKLITLHFTPSMGQLVGNTAEF